MTTQEIISYLKKIILIRKRLMEKGKSRNNTLQALADYEHVKINLETNQQRFTEKGLAKFFIRNEHRILNIIPGRDSGNHQKLMKEYYRIRLHCEMITNGKDKALPCLNDKTTKTGAL